MAQVSIITPCFNGAMFIEAMIRSAQKQTLTDWTLTIVDDGSTDGSAAIVTEAAASDRRIRLMRQENRGVCHARNAGFGEAPPSTYLLFLDADDMLTPDMLSVMTGHLDAHPDVGMAYCPFRVVDAAGRYIVTDHAEDELPKRFVSDGLLIRELPASHPETPLESLMSNHAAYPSVCLIRRSIYEQTSRWDPDFVMSEDKDLVVQLALRAPVHFVARHLVLYRRHSGNVSTSASAYPSLRQLEEKWWNAPGLSDEDRARARRAILFDRYVTVVRQLYAAVCSLKQGDIIGSARFALQSSRSLMRLLLRSMTYSSQPAVARVQASAGQRMLVEK